MEKFAQHKVLLVVTGGIAAYKALELVRLMRREQIEVRVVMTPAAQEFVGELSFQALSGQPVHTQLLDPAAESGMGHIELARWADVVVVAPASADFMARLAHGHADDLAATLCLATTAQILLAPAMNQQMWLNSATQTNLELLTERGFHVVGPNAGDQACGEVGPGRMSEPEQILHATQARLTQARLAGIRVMITAGPTQEAIDPVRFISNRSSGKMGYALAHAARDLGAIVDLISGPTALAAPMGVTTTRVVSAGDMYQAVMDIVNDTDIFIGSAAVADYRIGEPAQQKMKKAGDDMSLTLSPTQDILREVAALANPPFAVGFAAETENLLENARAKLERKHLDMIAANHVGIEGQGFDSDTNALHVIWKDGEASLAKASKDVIARQLMGLVADRFEAATAA